ncbi:hypothetical protein HHI36_006207, partial [Cryptolaemus montrouzieri]
GQVKCLKLHNIIARINVEITVPITPPMKPSLVLFGDTTIRGVFPKNLPKKYAKISLHTTEINGMTAQIIPSKTHFIIRYEGKLITINRTCNIANSLNRFISYLPAKFETNITKQPKYIQNPLNLL